jgi:uncharacterized protein YdaU (DUF1376 family)
MEGDYTKAELARIRELAAGEVGRGRGEGDAWANARKQVETERRMNSPEAKAGFAKLAAWKAQRQAEQAEQQAKMAAHVAEVDAKAEAELVERERIYTMAQRRGVTVVKPRF